jgi:hypothetical protein
MSVMPVSVMELALDFTRFSAAPAGVAAKEDAAKDLLHLVLSQRNSRKAHALMRAAVLRIKAMREANEQLRQLVAARDVALDGLQQAVDLHERRLDDIEHALSGVTWICGPGWGVRNQLDDLIRLQALHEAIIDGLVTAHPHMEAEAERLAETLRPVDSDSEEGSEEEG